MSTCYNLDDKVDGRQPKSNTTLDFPNYSMLQNFAWFLCMETPSHHAASLTMKMASTQTTKKRGRSMRGIPKVFVMDGTTWTDTWAINRQRSRRRGSRTRGGAGFKVRRCMSRDC